MRAVVGPRRGDVASLGPMLSGLLLEHFWWGSVFLIPLPLAVVALVLALKLVPAHVNEGTEPVDNLGGIISVIMIGSLVLGINFAAVPDSTTLAITLFAIAVIAGVAFILRQRRAANPLYDLDVAGRRIFWVAACAGIIVFGSLMGAMFVGQQFLQNVLGYDTFEARAAILPCAVLMVLVARARPSSSRSRAPGARCSPATRSSSSGSVDARPLERGHLLLGRRPRPARSWASASGSRGTPASRFAHRLRPGDPGQDGVRDGRSPARPRRAIMQSIFGALLAAGYASAAGAAIAASPKPIRSPAACRLS